MVRDIEAWQKLLPTLRARDTALVKPDTSMADLYYLPLRISKILGWIGLSIIAAELLTELQDGYDDLRFDLANTIVDQYEACMVTVSDEQAPFLYVFLKARMRRGKHALAERVTNLYFAHFAERGGNTTRAGADGATALRYIQTLNNPAEHEDWRPANPTHLLPVLLILGGKLNLEKTWDLRAFDRKSLCFFIPKDYSQFAGKTIEEGQNFTHRIGFGVWKVEEYLEEFQKSLELAFNAETLSFSPEGAILCTMAALLFPNRVPFILEAKIP